MGKRLVLDLDNDRYFILEKNWILVHSPSKYKLVSI